MNPLINNSIKLLKKNNNGFLRCFSSTCNKEQQQLILLENHLVNGKYTGIKILTLNSPKTYNALSFKMGEQLLERVKELKNDPTLKCVVLTGSNPGFCSGGVFPFLFDRATEEPTKNKVVMENFFNEFLSFRTIPVPIIAAINGPAIGAGLGVALGADIRIASKTARIGLNFMKIGVHTGMGVMHHMNHIVGSQIANYMILTADIVLGDEAKKLGIVLDSVEPEQLLPVTLKMAERISNNSSVCVRAATKSLRNFQDVDLQKNLTLEASAQSLCFTHPDYLEGISAIKEKRKPNFYYNQIMDSDTQ